MATDPKIKIHVEHNLECESTSIFVLLRNAERKRFAFCRMDDQWRWALVGPACYPPVARELPHSDPPMVDLVNVLLELDELIAKNPPGGLDA